MCLENDTLFVQKFSIEKRHVLKFPTQFWRGFLREFVHNLRKAEKWCLNFEEARFCVPLSKHLLKKILLKDKECDKIAQFSVWTSNYLEFPRFIARLKFLHALPRFSLNFYEFLDLKPHFDWKSLPFMQWHL